jgi:stress-induced morphogen
MVSSEEVRRRIMDGIPQAEVEVVDTTGGGDHFDVAVSAPGFAGRGLVEQHRMVYSALGDLMQVIHALALRTTAR